MYVCICNAVTDRAIREAAVGGVRTFTQLRRDTGCGDCCGSCEKVARAIFEQATQVCRLDLRLLAAAA